MDNDSLTERCAREQERIKEIRESALNLLKRARENIKILGGLSKAAQTNEEYVFLRDETERFKSECMRRRPEGGNPIVSDEDMSVPLGHVIRWVNTTLQLYYREIDRYISEAHAIGKIATEVLAKRRREQE